ncbi:MAG: (Fe-S)-binding protein [bacterium]
MHAAIFWGFWVLSINTIQFIMSGFVPSAHLPLLGKDQALGIAYVVFRDVFEVVVLIAVALAGLRRLVTRPKRLTYSFEAHVILFLIAALMVTDFLINGAEAAAVNPHSASFIEQVFGSWMLSWPVGASAVAGVTAWWVHLLALLYFLNLLPQSKHFHVVTSLFSVLFRRLDAPALKKVDLESAAEAEKFGAENVYDFGWKYILDSYSCTECGRCQDNCPTFFTGKELNPKLIEVDIREYLFENQRKLLSGGVEGENGIPKLLGGMISHQRIWDCTTCRACEEFCPLFIEHLGPIMDMRKHLVMDKAEFPDELGTFFKNIETQGNPWGIGQSNRTKWMEGLDVPIMADNPDKQVLLWIGCSASFDARNQKIARALVKCLKSAGIDFGYLGEEETCNGDSARRAGNEYLFQTMAEQVVETIGQYKNLKQIITPCPHCFNIFKNEYPEFGLKLDVKHHSTVLSKLIVERKLKPAKGNGHFKLAYHDSCYLGRYNGVYNAPRAVLAGVPGITVVEAERHHDKGMCCGAGGARMFMEEKHGSRINHARIEQLAKNSPDGVATACPYCLTMLGDAIKETGKQDHLRILDIAEVLADSIEPGAAEAS